MEKPAALQQSKYTPPFLDHERFVFRENLFRKLAVKRIERRKLIFIEAQAGQGKSVFAAQLLGHLQKPFCWYQLGVEDGDPVFFLKSLLTALSRVIPGFQSPLLEEMLAKKEAAASECVQSGRVLATDLEKELRSDFFLVFDDVYFLEGYAASLEFLAAMINEQAPKLHFVLVTRRPVASPVQRLLANSGMYLIGNRELALSRSETGELYAERMRVAVSTELIRKLHVRTEGWVMGLVLMGQLLGTDNVDDLLAGDSLPAHLQGAIPEYFLEEVLAVLPAEIRRSLVHLSLLDQLPLGLVEEIGEGVDNIRMLEDLVQRNFFIRNTDGEQKTYIFHHFFQESLRQQAARELSGPQIEETYRKAAVWFLAQARFEEALAYYLKAGDFADAHQVISEVGMALVSDHRIVTLKQALEMIPEEVVRAYPWYSYLTGVVCLDFSPPEALSWFERSRDLFAAVADPFGELLAMAQMIAFRMLVDGMYNEGELLLGRAEELFASQREALPAAIAIQTAQILAGGNCFFLCKMEKAAFYSSLGLQLAGEHGMENLVAGLRVMRCYENGLGRWAAYHAEVEQALPLFVSPRVSAINKLLLRIAAVNLLDMEGDFRSYQYHKERFERETSGDLLAKSIAAPFLLIWDIDLLVAGGRNEEAIRLARQGLTLPHGGANPHLRSQFLHYLAFLLAACGDYKEAAATAEESIRLRDIAGGALFRTLNLFIIGGAHALMGDAEQAENLLNQSIASAVDHNRFMLIGAHVHRAYNRLRNGREVESLKDIRIALKYLRENRFVHFFCWSPLIMKEILARAVRENIEPKYARHLATERLGSAILPDGRMIPLLEIKSLGTLELLISGAGRISAWDLTPAQRQLLALLITSPGSSLAQEQAQCILWPESPPEKSRSKLDNLLSRLRKLLAAAFEPHSVQDYLVLEKGILRLKHCVIDAKQFVRYGEKGLAHVRRREFWQADNAFRTANGFWQGEYLPGLDPDDAVSARREELSRLRVTISQLWSDILVGSNRAPEAADLLTATLRIDPFNQTLVRNLYNLRTIAGDLPGARKSLRQYRQGLAKEGFPPEEIEEMLESFWSQHSRFK